MNDNHDENCNCDYDDLECDCVHEEDMDIIYLTLDDGSELECNVVGIFEVDNYEYIALIPMDEDQVLLYRYEEYEDGMDLIDIEDDEEMEAVSEAFYTLYMEDDMDFDDDYYDFEDFDEE